jgi:hypothetical protein
MGSSTLIGGERCLLLRHQTTINTRQERTALQRTLFPYLHGERTLQNRLVCFKPAILAGFQTGGPTNSAIAPTMVNMAFPIGEDVSMFSL